MNLKAPIALAFVFIVFGRVYAQELTLNVRALDATELSRFQGGPDRQDVESGFTVRHDVEDWLLFGEPGIVIGTLVRRVIRDVEEETDIIDPAAKKRISIIKSTLESHVGERILAIDLKTAAVRQLELIGSSANDFQFLSCFALSTEMLGIIVRPRGAWEEARHRDVLWIWNPKTNEVQKTSQRSSVWKLHRAIDQVACRIDESKLESGHVTIINRNTGRSSAIEVAKSVPGRRPYDLPIIESIDFFAPTACPSSVIAIRDDACQIECIDTEADKGLRWTLSKEVIGSTFGGVPYRIAEVIGSVRPCSSLHVFVSGTMVGQNYYMRIGTKSGEIEKVFKLDVETHFKPVISKDGRWIAVVDRNGGTTDKLCVFDLENAGGQVAMPYADSIQKSWARLHVVGALENGAIILESGNGFWEVCANREWQRRKLFERLG